MAEIIIRDLIDEMIIWESQSKWPPNRTMLRRALHTLGHDHNWSDVHLGLSSSEAWAKRAKERRQRGKDKWARIARGIEQIEQREREFRKPAAKPWGITPKDNTGGETKQHKLALYLTPMHVPSLMDKKHLEVRGINITCSDAFRDILVKGAHTPDTDPRAVATLKREIKNKDALIAQKKREYEDLLNKNKGGANTQADLIGRQQVEIDELKQCNKQLRNDMDDYEALKATTGTKQTLNKEIMRLRAEVIRQQQKAQKYHALYEESLHDKPPQPAIANVQQLEWEIHDLKVKLHNAENKAANKQIDFQDAISGLMSGRVIEPELKGKVYLNADDIECLKIFKDNWQFALDTLPGTYVYGMKNKESAICKRHGITIDDYGQPTTAIQVQDFARTLQYMDNAIAHAHQEIQAAARVADMLIKAGQ